MRRAPATAAAVLLAGTLGACSSPAHPGAVVNPWAGDPFADAAPPDEPADASYPDPPGGSAVTWDGWVSGFSTVYCVPCHNPDAPCGGSECHSPSDPQVYALVFDLREKSAWTARAWMIHCGIVNVQDPAWSCDVPPDTYPRVTGSNPLPTDGGRGAVGDWFEAGCP